MTDLFSGSLESSQSQKATKPGSPRRKKKSEAPLPAKGQSRFGGKVFVTEVLGSGTQVNGAEFGGNSETDIAAADPGSSAAAISSQVLRDDFLGEIPKDPPLDTDIGRLARAVDVFKLFDMIEA